MSTQQIVLSQPGPHRDRGLQRFPQGRAGNRARGHRRAGDAEARQARPRRGRQRRAGQCDPGRQQDEPGATGSDRRWRSGLGAGDDGEPRLRLRRASHRHGRAADRHGRGRGGSCRRHGEHGPRALSDGRGTLGVPHGASGDPRQHASRWPQRCLLGQALGLAHRGSRRPRATLARRAGPLRRPLAGALQRGPEGRPIRAGDRCGGGPGQKGPRGVRGRRGAQARHHIRDPFEAAPRLPRGRDDHGRQRARPQQRGRRHDRGRPRLR